MTPHLAILRAGPACTLQDAGRTGFLRWGVTPAGPMDWIAHARANLMAGNPPGAGAVEIGPGGMTLTAEAAPLRLGIAARGFRVRREGSALPVCAAIRLRPGERFEIEPAPGPCGLWAYVAVAGGFDLPPVMGSLATHLRAGLGPVGALEAGMRLPALVPAGEGAEVCLIDPDPPPQGPLRVVPGPQDDRFVPGAVAAFAAAEWRVAPRSDRMAFRLAGPPLAHARGHDIVSDGIALGAVQVPGDGLPLVLMADRQPTGGYPKLATVIRADLPRLAQTRPGQGVRFAVTDVETAVAALRAAIPDRAALHARCRPMRVLRPPSGRAP